MKPEFRPQLKQTVQFSRQRYARLQVLEMSQSELARKISELVQTNPFIQSTSLDDTGFFENTAASSGKNLQEELMLQLQISRQSVLFQHAQHIIESLDEHGFFPGGVQRLEKELKIPGAAARQALELVQALEPAGVAASSSREALILQCRRKGFDQAASLLEHFSAEIEKGQIQLICSRMNVSKEQLGLLMEEIRTCSPYPCSEYDTSAPVLPAAADLIVRKEDDRLILETPEAAVSEVPTDPALLSGEMKAFLNEAHFFLDSLSRRSAALLMAGNEILKIQEAWFLYQGEKVPCTRQELAARLGVHVSTVSRTIKDKHLEFEGRLYPLSSFFQSQTKEGCSKDEVCRAIEWYIQREDPQSPWQDDQLQELLETDEIYASRRTIAKYRNQMGWPNSKNRKKKAVGK